MKAPANSALLALLLVLNLNGSLRAAERSNSPSRPTPATAPATTSGATHHSPTYLQDVLPILLGKCTRCHDEQGRVLRNWLTYQTAASDRWEIKRRVWDSWRGLYFKQPMPAGNSPESQAMTEAERRTIRDWVKGGAVYGTAPIFGTGQSKAEQVENGKRLFTTICAACHQLNGQGVPSRFPPLARSDFLNADKHRAIQVVLNGLQGEVVVNGQRFNNTMPKLPLSDEQIASALTYVYNAFGNSGQEVTPQEVSTARANKTPALTPTGQSAGYQGAEGRSPWE